jgi:2-keto-4-pentenoate hydratase/2-oxohepta-3-ene-1,7-dioic acid hydratase in catechol pathway
VPAYYKGMPDTVVGPDTEVSWPAYSDELDHELELAAVIGCTVKDVAPEDALAGIFGYTIWNDFSARDTQRREVPVGMGPAKAKDWDGSNASAVHRHPGRVRRHKRGHEDARQR